MNALAKNNVPHNGNNAINSYYDMFVTWFPKDKSRINNIYGVARTNPQEAAVQLRAFLDEKIDYLSKISSQKKYAEAAETLRRMREQIIVPRNPWKICFDGLVQTGKHIMEFSVKKGLIRMALSVGNKIQSIYTKFEIPEEIIDKIATGITIFGKHLVKPLKIVAQKTVEATKAIARKTVSAVQKVSSFVSKVRNSFCNGIRNVAKFIISKTVLIK